MTKPIGVTIHREDGSALKVGINDLAAAYQALMSSYGGTGGGGGRYNYLNADSCPTHGPWKAVPAGVSKSTGKPYPAFYACDQEMGEERCTNKPNRDWVQTHPIGGVSIDQAPTPEPPEQGGSLADKMGEFDDLPF